MLDFSKASLTDIRQKLRDLLTAKEAGFNVPQMLIETLQSEILTREGVREVWECVRCDEKVHLNLPAIEVACRCGKIRRTWQSSVPA